MPGSVRGALSIICLNPFHLTPQRSLDTIRLPQRSLNTIRLGQSVRLAPQCPQDSLRRGQYVRLSPLTSFSPPRGLQSSGPEPMSVRGDPEAGRPGRTTPSNPWPDVVGL